MSFEMFFFLFFDFTSGGEEVGKLVNLQSPCMNCSRVVQEIKKINEYF